MRKEIQMQVLGREKRNSRMTRVKMRPEERRGGESGKLIVISGCELSA